MTHVTVTTAVKLTSAQTTKITKAVQAAHPDADIQQVVDPDVVGGIKIKIDSTLLDATVSSKLSQLKNQLLNISKE